MIDDIKIDFMATKLMIARCDVRFVNVISQRLLEMFPQLSIFGECMKNVFWSFVLKVMTTTYY